MQRTHGIIHILDIHIDIGESLFCGISANVSWEELCSLLLSSRIVKIDLGEALMKALYPSNVHASDMSALLIS